jgi:hypothetical protein
MFPSDQRHPLATLFSSQSIGHYSAMRMAAPALLDHHIAHQKPKFSLEGPLSWSFSDFLPSASANR